MLQSLDTPFPSVNPCHTCCVIILAMARQHKYCCFRPSRLFWPRVMHAAMMVMPKPCCYLYWARGEILSRDQSCSHIKRTGHMVSHHHLFVARVASMEGEYWYIYIYFIECKIQGGEQNTYFLREGVDAACELWSILIWLNIISTDFTPGQHGGSLKASY